MQAMRRQLAACFLLFALGAAAQEFTLEDIQGKTHRLADYRGKWVLVNYWATWCPPCLDEIPELISLHNAHHDKDLLVIGIAMDSGSTRKVADFAKAHLALVRDGGIDGDPVHPSLRGRYRLPVGPLLVSPFERVLCAVLRGGPIAEDRSQRA